MFLCEFFEFFKNTFFKQQWQGQELKNWDFVGTVIETLIRHFVANGYQWKWWDFLLTSVIFYSCLRISCDHLHLKVLSASIAAFRISLAISPHFVWISSKNFSFFIFQCFTKKFEFYNLKSYWILTYSRLPESNGTSEHLKEYFIVLLRVWV